MKTLFLSNQKLQDLHYQFKHELLSSTNPLIKYLIKYSIDQMVIFDIPEEDIETFKLIIKLKKVLNNLTIIWCKESVKKELISSLLQKNILNYYLETSSLIEIQKNLELLHTAPEQIKTIKVLWCNSEGLIHWNQTPDSRPAETLLILMPAWGNRTAPLGIACLKAYAEEKNLLCKAIDLNLHFWRDINQAKFNKETFEDLNQWVVEENYRKNFQKYLQKTFERLEETLKNSSYSFVGFSLYQANLFPSMDAMRLLRLKFPHVKILAGGPECSEAWAQKAFSEGLIDSASFGEGEASFVELIQNWKGQKESPVRGALFRNKEGKLISADQQVLLNIDELPAPNFSDFFIYNYDSQSLPLYFSRGCVAKCTFCAETLFWKKYRQLSSSRIIEMITKTIALCGIKNFYINDSLINGLSSELEELIHFLEEKKLDITFEGYCRLDPKLNYHYFKKLKGIGCQSLVFGMESGSQKILDLMQKITTNKENKRIIKECHKAEIQTVVCIIVGHKNENWFDYLKTVFSLIALRSSIDELVLSKLEFPHHIAGKRWISSLRYLFLYKLWRLMKNDKISKNLWRIRPE